MVLSEERLVALVVLLLVFLFLFPVLGLSAGVLFLLATLLFILSNPRTFPIIIRSHDLLSSPGKNGFKQRCGGEQCVVLINRERNALQDN